MCVTPKVTDVGIKNVDHNDIVTNNPNIDHSSIPSDSEQGKDVVQSDFCVASAVTKLKQLRTDGLGNGCSARCLLIHIQRYLNGNRQPNTIASLDEFLDGIIEEVANKLIDEAAVYGQFFSTSVFLSETIKDISGMELIRVRLKYKSCLAVSKEGRSGGLALLWNASIEVSISSFSRNHIDALVQDDNGRVWRFTGFYGNPSTSGRPNSWHLLRNLSANWVGPWICAGDFNEILSLDEKSGGATRPFQQMASFNDALQDCNLTEIPVLGPMLT